MSVDEARRSAAARGTAALLVEGGGLRGAFGAGVLSELARSGTRFDDVFAVSSGAPTAAYLVAGQVEDAVRIWEHHTHGEQLVSPRRWIRGATLLDIDGLIGVFERVVPLDTARLGRAEARCWIVVTNCHTGRPDHVRATPGNAMDLLRATMALPIAYGKVVAVGGVPYVDGGVVEAVPVRRAAALDHDRKLLVLTQPRGYRGRDSRAAAWLLGLGYARYPAIRRALGSHFRTSNEALDLVDDLERRGALSVIRPRAPLAAGTLSTRRRDILATLDAGREAAWRWLRDQRP
jgi:predicted patatin/cPLA2 family phospholipase